MWQVLVSRSVLLIRPVGRRGRSGRGLFSVHLVVGHFMVYPWGRLLDLVAVGDEVSRLKPPTLLLEGFGTRSTLVGRYVAYEYGRMGWTTCLMVEMLAINLYMNDVLNSTLSASG